MATRTKETTLKLLLLPLKDLCLALPLEGVVKVIRTPEIFRGGSQVFGVAHFDQEATITIDLHQRIYGSPNPEPEQYVVLIKAVDDQLYGLLSTTLPVIKEVDRAIFSALPTNYREHDSLGIASHTATIVQGTLEQTIFLLDLSRLLNESLLSQGFS